MDGTDISAPRDTYHPIKTEAEIRVYRLLEGSTPSLELVFLHAHDGTIEHFSLERDCLTIATSFQSSDSRVQNYFLHIRRLGDDVAPGMTTGISLKVPWVSKIIL